LKKTTSDHLAAFATKKKMAAKEREKKEFEELQEFKENMLCKVMCVGCASAFVFSSHLS
jgi:hypothetical protein